VCEPKRVLNGYPLRNFFASLLRRLEFDLTRRANRVFSETVRNSPHYSYAIEFSVTEQQEFENNVALDSDASRFACVFRLRPLRDFGFHVNFLRTKPCDRGRIEEMRE